MAKFAEGLTSFYVEKGLLASINAAASEAFVLHVEGLRGEVGLRLQLARAADLRNHSPGLVVGWWRPISP